MQGTFFILKTCFRLPSLLRHPVCVTVLTIWLELPVMTDLFSMYEIDIICLWTWHHWLVNSCEATQTFGREALRVFFLLFWLWFQHWEMPLTKIILCNFYLCISSTHSHCVSIASVLSCLFPAWGSGGGVDSTHLPRPLSVFFGCPPFPLSHGVNDDPRCS